MESLISVIVPVYNVEKYLHRCVQSVLEQTYRNLEIILVDDGSTDESGHICDILANTDKRITVVHQKNAGLSAARNKGIEISHGEYIAFVDSDDYIDTKMYERMLTKMQLCNADMVICGYSKWLEEQNRVVETEVNFEECTRQGKELFTLLFREELSVLMPVAWNKLYKRALWDKLCYPVGKYHEDEYMIHHLLNRCKTVAMVPEKLYIYSVRTGSIMASRALKAGRDWAEALLDRAALYENIGEEKLAEKQREHCIRMILWECKKMKEIHLQEKEFIREMALSAKNLAKRHKVSCSVGAKVFMRFPITYIKLNKKLV